MMSDVRFGIVTAELQAKPFCLPPRDLTNEELNLIHKRFSKAHPQLPEMNTQLLASILTGKSYRCGEAN